MKILSLAWVLMWTALALGGQPGLGKEEGSRKPLPLPGERFEVGDRPAFVILPATEARQAGRPMPWVWYAPTLPGLPSAEERWMFERFLTAGIAVAGIDVGESYGSPQGRVQFSALYNELVERRGFSRQPCLLARSRGGLMLYNWAAEHPQSVAAIVGIYPVCDLSRWPGLNRACGAYGMSAQQLGGQLEAHNPIDRLAPLAAAGVPIFHIQGDSDKVVPLEDHSAVVARRYRDLGGSMRLRVVPGQGHNMWSGFFQCRELVDFVIAHASPVAQREPTPALFENPPMEARPGAFWSWMNGDVDLDRLTFELEEMKAKGMSGAEIWDIGVIRKIPEEPVPAGPPFLGPESLKAINHAIDVADRLDLQLGMVASSSWNAGGSWVEPRDAMKSIYHSEIVISGPAKLSQVLPFPANRAPAGADGRPVYFKEIAVLACPESPDRVIPDPASVINLSANMKQDGSLTWDVPAGSWRIMRFITTNTGEMLKVPSPNSNGLVIDHLDADAAAHHFQYIVDQILKTRPSFDALRYMEVDSVEMGGPQAQDWTDSFVEEFRKRRGYDPIPYLPALKGTRFADPQVASRFLHDYRMTVSDLWIDGHYRASTRFLNAYGVKLVAEAGHGGYPRIDPLRALGAVDIPRGEFWNGEQFWVVKEAASAAHIYNRQIVDVEGFTGWRSWQDGPLEYKRLADASFCEGLNRITFHTFAHTPPHGGVPGHIYHAGEHFNVNTTWWNQAGPMLSYFSRCSYLLQQGLPVADACFYYGHDAPNLVATRRIGPDTTRHDFTETCAHCKEPNPASVGGLGAGYDYDVIDSEVIGERMEFRDGQLVLPHGVGYSVIVLPDRDDMPLPVLQKLERLVFEGATLLGPRPSRDTTLADYPRRDEEIREIAGRMWGPAAATGTTDRIYGKGRIIEARQRVREVLLDKGIGPDFSFTGTGKPVDLDYVHRRTPQSDIYFVSNTQMEEAVADCTFRVPSRRPQLWHPDTGRIEPCTEYERVAGGMKLRIHLPPAGSVFVVFSGSLSETAPTAPPADEAPPTTVALAGPWEVTFPPNLGAPPSHTFDPLVSWTEVEDEGIRYFSGTATYLKRFDVDSDLIAGGNRIELSLGRVRNVAEVTLNGRPLGILWKPPFACDVTGLLREGSNELKIGITNLWANRLAGDAKLPREKRVTRIVQRVPLGAPLESGLLGPVELRVGAGSNAR